MVLFVIQNAEVITMELVQFVGKIVYQISQIMEHFVQNQNHMVEVLVMQYGIKKNVKEEIVQQDVKKTVQCGIQNVYLDFIM